MTPGVQRARLQFDEHKLGDWMRARRAPDVRLSGLLLDREPVPARPYQHSRAQFASWLEARAAGATLVRELQDTDCGSREYSVRDPEDNLWSWHLRPLRRVVAHVSGHAPVMG